MIVPLIGLLTAAIPLMLAILAIRNRPLKNNRTIRNSIIENFESQTSPHRRAIMEAFTPGTFFNPARSIEVRIQAIEGKEGLFFVLVKTTPFVHYENKAQVSVSSVESSKVINRFINYLISTPDDADKKSQKEVESA